MEVGDSNRRGILLVCQSEDTLSALAAILQQVGHRCLKAQTPEAALSCVKGGVQSVILDLSIPTTDALAIFRELRCSRTTSAIPFLFLVSDGIVPTLPPGTEPGAAPDAWLTLPCTAQAFVDSLRDLERKAVAYAQLSPPLERRAERQAESEPKAPEPAEALQKQKAADSSGQMSGTDHIFLGPDGVFGGRLSEALDVPKLISVIEPIRLTGVLHLVDDKKIGQIHFADGKSRHADFHGIEGEDALFLLLNLKSGVFRFELAAESDKKTLQGNTMALLLEGLRQMDENKAMINAYQQEKASRVSERAKAIKP